MAKADNKGRPSSGPFAAILAWMVPGLGHWWIGERMRGLIFFVVTTVTFWGGIAVGGVRTAAAPTGNGAWVAAQLCMGPQAMAAIYLSHQQVENAKALGKESPKSPWPSSNIGMVYAGIAGLLNLLVIIDALSRVENRRASVQARPPPNRAPPKAMKRGGR